MFSVVTLPPLLHDSKREKYKIGGNKKKEKGLEDKSEPPHKISIENVVKQHSLFCAN